MRWLGEHHFAFALADDQGGGEALSGIDELDELFGSWVVVNPDLTRKEI